MHIICSNTSFTEYEVLWHDWHWVERHLENIFRLKGEDRRFNLQALLSSMAYAFGGEANKNSWIELFESTYTDEELESIGDMEDREANEMLEMQRAERTAAFLAAEVQGRDFLITGFDMPDELAVELARKQGLDVSNY